MRFEPPNFGIPGEENPSLGPAGAASDGSLLAAAEVLLLKLSFVVIVVCLNL